MEDLWGFHKEDLRCSNSEAISILKDQADLLSRKTDGVLKGKLKNNVLSEEVFERTGHYNLETVLEVVVPSLDNYRSALVYVYSNAEKNFPVRLSVKKLNRERLDEPCKPCNRKLTAENEDEFVEILKELLGSPAVNETIRILYQKAWVD